MKSKFKGKKYLYAVLFFFFLGLFLFPKTNDVVFSSGFVSDVSSIDGILSLDLPEGVDSSIIEIKKVDEGVYELLPDGLIFDEPVKFEFYVLQDSLIPLVFHLNESGMEIVDNTFFDPINQLVSGEISHFSKLSIPWNAKFSPNGYGGFFSVEYSNPPFEHEIGESFVFKFKVIPNPDNVVEVFQDIFGAKLTRTYEVSLKKPSTYRMNWYQGAVLTPTYTHYITPYKAVIPSEVVAFDKSFEHSQSFTCVKKGSTSIIADHKYGRLPIEYTVVVKTYDHNSDSNTTKLVGEEDFNVKTELEINEPHSCIDEPEYALIGPPMLCDPSGEYEDLPSCE